MFMVFDTTSSCYLIIWQKEIQWICINVMQSEFFHCFFSYRLLGDSATCPKVSVVSPLYRGAPEVCGGWQLQVSEWVCRGCSTPKSSINLLVSFLLLFILKNIEVGVKLAGEAEWKMIVGFIFLYNTLAHSADTDDFPRQHFKYAHKKTWNERKITVNQYNCKDECPTCYNRYRTNLMFGPSGYQLFWV